MCQQVLSTSWTYLEIITLMTAHEVEGGGNSLYPKENRGAKASTLPRIMLGLVCNRAGSNPRPPVLLPFMFFTLTCRQG